jgi:predicted RNA polymerase sigma factor
VHAAITALHAEARTWEETDWEQIVGRYDVLHRAVTIGLRDGPQAGLVALAGAARDPRLAGCGYLSAAGADLLRQPGSAIRVGRGVTSLVVSASACP